MARFKRNNRPCPSSWTSSTAQRYRDPMMHFTTTWLGLAQGLLYSVASASDPASGVGENVRVLSRGRPGHTIGPYHPGKSFLRSPPRNKTCVILNPGCCAEDQDDSANIMLAIEQCNDGGHVIFEPGTYMIGTPLDLTSLKHIDLGRWTDAIRPLSQSLSSVKNTEIIRRDPRYNKVHKRHHLLASQLLQTHLPKLVYVLPARWDRCQRLWWRHLRWQWSGLV